MTDAASPRAEPAPRDILGGAGVDMVGNAVMALAAELWAVTDRLRILEAVLDARGIDVHDAVDRFVPDAALERELDARRDKLINNIVQALRGDQA